MKQIEKLGLPVDTTRVKMAYEFAKAAHAGQKRFSGEPYILHPLEVAYKLLEFNPDEDMVVAALLHDVSEDTEKTLDDIEEFFGPGVRNLVRGLEKLSKVRSRIDESQVENLRKMFVAMATDLRVILIKLCDRWHNMETLEHVREEKQKRIAKETLDIYVPIASRLGIYRIKGELEDLCFKFLYSDLYNDIDDQVSRYGKERSKYIDSVTSTLKRFLFEKGYDAKIESRVKTHYSIYRKLKRKGKSSIDDIFDVYAVRIIIPQEYDKNGEENNSKLYQLLGVVHSEWTPLTNRFKDYVAVPKPNGYRSLHTTIIGVGSKDFNQPVEVQIRTDKMHSEAEFGIASHWLYDDTDGASTKSGFINDGKRPKKTVLESQLAWVKALEELQSEISNNAELIQDLQTDLFNDRIFVLTPQGDVRDLPAGATPIDFAYSVHSDVGNHCVMAKVNGSIVPLDYELHNGEVVDILTRKNAEPNQFWMSFVKTNGAKNKIKSWFKSKDSDRNIKSGKELLNKYLERIGKSVLDPDYTVLKKYGGSRLTFKEREKILEEIGLGMILPSQVVKAVFPLEDLLLSTKSVESTEKKKMPLGETRSLSEDVVVDGLDGIPVRFATCCKPKQCDMIIGYAGRDKKVAIHKIDCKMITRNNPDRRIAVHWSSCIDQHKYRVNLVVQLEDRIGLLRDMSNIISDEGVNIVDLSMEKTANENVKLRNFVVEIISYDQLEHLMNRLERIPSVISVKKLD